MLFNGFMAAIWDKWASKKTIINATKRVGITATALDVNSIQQDKFEEALNCMAEVKQKFSESARPEKISTLSLNTNAVVPITSCSAKHRFGSAAFWKYMYDRSEIIHQESYANSLQLEEIPGVLTVNRVKHKEMSQKTN